MKKLLFLSIFLFFAKPVYSQAIDLRQSISQAYDSLKIYHIPFDTIDISTGIIDNVVIKIKKKDMFGLSGDEYIEFDKQRLVSCILWVYDDTATVQTKYKFSWNVRKRLYNLKAPESVQMGDDLSADSWTLPDRKTIVSLSKKGELSFDLYISDYRLK